MSSLAFRIALFSLLALIFGFAGSKLAGAQDAAPPSEAGICYANAADGTRVIVPLESTEVVMDIKPGLLETQVIQTFTNHTNTALEANYLYPLPHDGTITGFELRYGDHVLKSVVREKKQAVADYTAAKAQGRKAALLEQHDPALFSTAVANFMPGETVHVVIRFTQPLTLSADAVEVRFPMVTAVKYFPPESTPGTPGNAAPTPLKRDSSDLPHHYYAYDISVRGFPVQSITSSSHRISVEHTSADRYQVSLAEEITLPDRDFVLRIETAQSGVPQPTLVTEHTTNEDFGLVTLFPPQKAERSIHAAEGRDFLFLVDHSGSMQGPRIQSARLGLQASLRSLSPKDRFQIVIFDSTYSFYKNEWTSANATEVAAANQYISALQADSGTEMQPALDASLQFIKARDQKRQTVIIFLTDGDVGNEAALFTLLEAKIDRNRLFAFGIGSEPNIYLLNKMAEYGRGQARFISDDESIARELADLFSTLDSPVLTDVKLSILDAAGNVIPTVMFPEKLSDVFAGRPIQAIFSFSGVRPATVQVNATRQGKKVVFNAAAPQDSETGDGLQKRFGQMRYEERESQRRRALSPAEKDAISDQMRQIALQYQLVSEFTSRVAIDQRISRDPTAPVNSVNVAQYKASDQSPVIQIADPNDETVVLSPFVVDASEDAGSYTANSTVAGTRVRTELKDVASAITVITKSFLDDIAPVTLEEGAPFTLLQTQQSSRVPADDQTSMIDSLPLATIVDLATIDQIEFQPQGTAWTNVYQRSPGIGQGQQLTVRLGDGGFAAATYQSSFKVGTKSDIPALAMLSYSQLDQPQWSVLLSGKKFFGDDRLRLSAQIHQLDGYGQMTLLHGSFEHQFNDGLSLLTTVAWHELNRENPRQFFLGSSSFYKEGLGIFNLDQLTSTVQNSQDFIAESELDGGFSSGSVRQTWAVEGLWHAQGSHELTPFSSDPVARQRNEFSGQINYRANFFGNRLALTTDADLTTHHSSDETISERSLYRASTGLTWQTGTDQHVFFNLNQGDYLPWFSSGEGVLVNGSALTVSSPVEHRRGVEAGWNFGFLDDRISGSFSLFHEQVGQASYRDWSLESNYPNAAVIDLGDGILRLPLNYGVADPFTREGFIGQIDFRPTPALEGTIHIYEDWKNEGPTRGGNRLGSALVRYTFQQGMLKGFAFGVSTNARNTLTYDDGYKLNGGVRWDILLKYRWHGWRSHWTTAQINLINLNGISWQPTRFAADRGRQLLLSLTQEF